MPCKFASVGKELIPTTKKKIRVPFKGQVAIVLSWIGETFLRINFSVDIYADLSAEKQ